MDFIQAQMDALYNAAHLALHAADRTQSKENER
jgi:hypothetical protein